MKPTPFTFEEALQIQTEHLIQWASVLKPEIFTQVFLEATKDNHKIPSNTPDRVVRGSTIDAIVRNVALRAANSQMN